VARQSIAIDHRALYQPGHHEDFDDTSRKSLKNGSRAPAPCGHLPLGMIDFDIRRTDTPYASPIPLIYLGQMLPNGLPDRCT
jgi:hypothetical protein